MRPSPRSLCPTTRQEPPPEGEELPRRPGVKPAHDAPERAQASPLWETLETYAREQIQHFVQRLLEEEVEALLGRGESARRREATPVGYRNGYGKPRQLALTSGTITVQRPCVRDLALALPALDP